MISILLHIVHLRSGLQHTYQERRLYLLLLKFNISRNLFFKSETIPQGVAIVNEKSFTVFKYS